ncbi:tetratricopeptide repeat protein [Paraliomyxa miuraensis]|uniref:tetratricopeptide repeat protein n=1 Tax=Paraliomyxa miuraensis TaxID=376150 RepID=UPI0022554E76|nr:tetratricopeptide repeat protein [Paraliomyxa miuraensis]MCX4246408.1 tetratricopeptide repeat protein [Paraliomyxa miuraensis]
MRRVSLALAIALPMLVASTPGCKLTSRNRAQAINRMNEGIRNEAKNNTSQAEKALKEAIEFDPTYDKAHFHLGQIYRKQGKLVDAQKAFQDAIANMSEAPKADYQYQLGRVIIAQAEAAGVSQADREAKYKEAIAAFQEAIKLDPSHYRAYYHVGKLYDRLDQPIQADEAFRKAIEVNARFVDSFVDLGNMYIDYGHANVGLAVLDAGVQVNDKNASMWNGLGRAYSKLNRHEEAVDAFKKAKAIDPDRVDVLYGLGKSYAELRMRAEALEHLQAFLQRAGQEVPEHLKKDANNTVARMQDVI